MTNIQKTLKYTLVSLGGFLIASTPGYSANLTLDWNNTNFIAGDLDQTFSLGKGDINFQFELKNGTSFASFQGNSTPQLTEILTGTNSGVSLHLQRRPSNNPNNRGSIELNTSFLGYNKGVISGLTFDIFDIDSSGNNSQNNSWQDRVIVKGLLRGNEVTPTFNIFNGSNVSQSDSFTLDGKRSVNNNQDGGNVRVSFDQEIDSFTMIFTDNPGVVNTSSTQNHGIGIGNMSFQTVPEPSMIGGLVFLGFLGLTGAKKKSPKS